MFIVSKVIGYLLDPFLWILILLVAAWIIHDKKLKSNFLKMAFLVFIFFSNNYIINNIWNAYQWKPVKLASGSTYEAGIILGGLAGYDEDLKLGFFGNASDRFIQTARLYQQGHIKNIIVTGGNAIFVKDAGYNEADFIARNLEELKIPSSQILLEKRARNTLENASFSGKLMDSASIHPPGLLITSAIHMPRAMKIFSRQGIKVDAFPCNYRVLPVDTKLTWISLIPSHEAFEKWTLLLKEWVGMLMIR